MFIPFFISEVLHILSFDLKKAEGNGQYALAYSNGSTSTMSPNEWTHIIGEMHPQFCTTNRQTIFLLENRQTDQQKNKSILINFDY